MMLKVVFVHDYLYLGGQQERELSPYDRMPWPFNLAEPQDAQVASRGTQPGVEQLIPMLGTEGTVQSKGMPGSREPLLPEYFSSRAHNQLSYLAAGTLLFASSVLLSRRAVVSRLRIDKPAGLFSSSRTTSQVNGAVDAASALTLATLNVGTFGAMLAGGSMWAFDIRTIDDVRRYVRREGLDTRGVAGPAVEEEKEDDIEAWMTFFSNSIQGKTDLLPKDSNETPPKE